MARLENDYKRQNLPVFDAEPCYESHPIMNEFTFSCKEPGLRFTDREIRRSSFWSVFSGGAGITYGCYGIWQMRREEDDKVEIPESAASAYRNDTMPYWHESLNFAAAFQVPLIKKFMENLPNPLSVKPDNSLILSQNPSDERHLCALTDEDHSFIAVYVPTYEHFTVDISCFNLDGFEIYWYDPRFGIYNFLSSDNRKSQFLNIAPPNSGDDYVLLLKRK